MLRQAQGDKAVKANAIAARLIKKMQAWPFEKVQKKSSKSK
jgi:hypothetical protein